MVLCLDELQLLLGVLELDAVSFNCSQCRRTGRAHFVGSYWERTTPALWSGKQELTWTLGARSESRHARIHPPGECDRDLAL